MLRALLLFLNCLLFQIVPAQNRQDFKTNQTDTFYGKPVSDPYRMLEDTGNAKVKAWMHAEADKTNRFFASLPGSSQMHAQVKAIMDNYTFDEIDAVNFYKGKYYVTKRKAGQENFSLYAIDAKGKEELVIDPQKANPKITSKNLMLAYFNFEENAPYMMYLLIAGGNESDPKIVMRNMNTGQEQTDTLYLNNNTGISSFDPKRADAFYYTNQPNYRKAGVDPTHWNDSSSIGYHIIGTNPLTDKTIIAVNPAGINKDIDDMVNLVVQKGLNYVYAIIKNKVANQYRIYGVKADAFNGTATQWKLITDYDDKISQYAFAGNYLFAITQKDAPNSKVIRIDMRNGLLADAITLVPNSKALVKQIALTKNELLVSLSDAGQGRLLRIANAGTVPQNIALPLKGNIKLEWSNTKENDFVVSVTSWVKLKTYFTYHAAANKITTSSFDKQTGTQNAGLTVEDVLVKSYDGVMVPLTIIYKKGLKMDGTHPVVLRAYGAYGFVDDPSFWPESMIFFNKGGIRAIAHVRGGGIYGEAWKLAGQKANKPNTWKDVIACAGYLIDKKYATNKNLIAVGGSAGGITIGRSVTERPDLFGAAIISVGALDMVRMETSPNGKGNIPEYGSTATKAGFDALYAMSAYHHVQPLTPYPAIIFTHGVNDSRVPVWMSLKMAALMQDASTSGNPVLLDIDFDSGHGAQETTSSIIDRVAKNNSFCFYIAAKQ